MAELVLDLQARAERVSTAIATYTAKLAALALLAAALADRLDPVARGAVMIVVAPAWRARCHCRRSPRRSHP